jgi:hypothetical protein
MQKLAVSDLQKNGYTEDRAAYRAFLHRYVLASHIGLFLCVVPYPFNRYVWSPFTDPSIEFIVLLTCFVVGVALIAAYNTYTRDAIPVSLHTGLPMERFLRSDPAEGHIEYLYVDHSSRTYFTFLIGVPPGAGA